MKAQAAKPPFLEEGEVFKLVSKKEKPEALRELLVLTAEAFYEVPQEDADSGAWIRSTAAVI